jgi:hypothetical protein
MKKTGLTLFMAFWAFSGTDAMDIPSSTAMPTVNDKILLNQSVIQNGIKSGVFALESEKTIVFPESLRTRIHGIRVFV